MMRHLHLLARHLCYVLDADNRPRSATHEELARWCYEHGDRRHIAVTEIRTGGGVVVSTIFNGIDHRLFDAGPPLVFETIIFGGALDGQVWRYASHDDAVTGHAVAVRKATENEGKRWTTIFMCKRLRVTWLLAGLRKLTQGGSARTPV